GRRFAPALARLEQGDEIVQDGRPRLAGLYLVQRSGKAALDRCNHAGFEPSQAHLHRVTLDECTNDPPGIGWLEVCVGTEVRVRNEVWEEKGRFLELRGAGVTITACPEAEPQLVSDFDCPRMERERPPECLLPLRTRAKSLRQRLVRLAVGRRTIEGPAHERKGLAARGVALLCQQRVGPVDAVLR